MVYTAYNLIFDSQLPLPELMVAAAPQSPDVSIRFGHVSPHALPDTTQLGPYLWASPAGVCLHVPRIARFLIQDGNSILIDAETGIDEDSVRVFLLGSAFGALLHQRGLLVLHGNAIRIGDACMVCIGNSGAGKSTLAAGFSLLGHEVLADDVVAVDAQCHVLPGYPRIKLWKDVAEQLEIDTRPLSRIRPALEKFNFPVQPSSSQALPIRWIYLLNNDEGEGLRFEPIHGLARFQPLHDNTYRLRFLNGMAIKAEHLRLCGQVATRARLAQVTRPRSGFCLDQLIERIQTDISENP